MRLRGARRLAVAAAVVTVSSAGSVVAAPARPMPGADSATAGDVGAQRAAGASTQGAARPMPGADSATAGDVGAQRAAGARGYTGVHSVQAPARSPGRMPGSRSATAGDVGSRVASGATHEEEDDDEDRLRGPALPGADEATEGDAAARVASGASADEFHPWEVGGFIDANYAYNNNLPDNHIKRGTAVQPRSGEFTLNLVVAYIRRDALPGRLSPTFELALQAGPAADALMRDEPSPGGEASRVAGSEVWKHLARANVGLKTRGGTELTAGLLLSPIGVGIHWSPYNWNYTPTWQLDGVPYYLAGVRVAHPINARHGVQLWVVNGWQTAADNNKAPSFLLGYTFTPSPRFAFAQYVYTGPENADMRLAAWRLFSDTQFTYNRERFGVSAVFDLGAERRTDLPGKPWNVWSSGGVFTRWRVLGERRTWDMALRPDWFYDRNGRIFGVSQHLISGTYTNDIRIAENLLLRVEYRYDRSISHDGYFYRGSAITDDAKGLAHDQHSVFFSIAGVFAHRFGKVKR